MKKIIDSTPAPYPKTSTPEYEAVVTLINIINKNRIKFDLNILDKFPNTDGIFEIVSKSQIPIGKIDIQVKFLPQKNTKKPKYQCTKDFLAFCEQSILPVLLVVVDVQSEKAYWIHVNRSVLIELSENIKGETVNLDVPKSNLIAKNENEYINQWEIIVSTYLTRLIDFDELKDELELSKTKYQKLQEITNPALCIENEIFSEIHFFLDYYNNLLENEFSIIKDIYYREYWKIGLAYSTYEDTRLSYSLYPIKYNYNDIQIKVLEEKEALKSRDFINYVGHNVENPIKIKPLEYAFKYIIDDLKKIVDNNILLHIDEFIANEYIISFIDKYLDILGLEKEQSNYSIEDIEKAISTFLPLFCEEQAKKKISSNEKILVDLDMFYFHVFPDERKAYSLKAKERFDKGETSENSFAYKSDSFNFRYLSALVKHLENIGKTNATRLYPNKKYHEKQRSFIWKIYNSEEIEKIVSLIYLKLPDLYNKFVNEFFPKLYDEINFFNHFDRLVVNLRVKDISIDYTDDPSIEHIYLKNLENNSDNRIDVYLLGKDESPLTWEIMWKQRENDIIIDNQKYEIISYSTSRLDNVFELTPMQDFLYDTLKNRLDGYLSPYTNGSHSIFQFTKY